MISFDSIHEIYTDVSGRKHVMVRCTEDGADFLRDISFTGEVPKESELRVLAENHVKKLNEEKQREAEEKETRKAEEKSKDDQIVELKAQVVDLTTQLADAKKAKK
jgi:hypothetical protein